MSLRRNSTVDGLRAFAIAAVGAVHALGRFFPGGGLGVDLFFVISGYVITAGLLREREANGSIDIRAFYVRRMRRLWPALWAMVAAVALAHWLMDKGRLLEIAAALLSFMNWARAFGSVDLASDLGHTWSLAIEEQFYLIWPMALMLLASRQHATMITLFAILAICIWRAYLIATGVAFDTYVYNATECRADALLVGCLIAWNKDRIPASVARLWPIAALALCAMICLGFPSSNLAKVVYFPITAALSGVLVYAAVREVPVLASLMGPAPVQWVGLRSYSLYLWHLPIIHFLGPVPLWFPFKLAAELAASILCAECSYRLLERPFMRNRSLKIIRSSD